MKGPAKAFVEELDEEVRDRLALFRDLLVQWGARTNLVGPSLLADPWPAIRDAIEPVRLGYGISGTLLDVGSGGGFPALPLSIVARPERVVLVEPRERRWAFLVRALRELGLAGEAIRGRWEEIDAGLRASVITSRGLAGLEDWGPAMASRLEPGGRILFYGRLPTPLPVAIVAERQHPLPSGGRLHVLVPRGTFGSAMSEWAPR